MTISNSTVIEFPAKERILNNSVFLFIDLQREYLSTGRRYAMRDIDKCLKNCKKVLRHARECGMTIAHFRTIKSGTFFNQRTDFSNWIEAFAPQPNEMVFEREQPSIYANAAFASFIEQVESPELIAVGLSGERSLLSSAVEASHRNHRFTFIHDASATASMGRYSEDEAHEVVSNIMRLYGEVLNTDRILQTIGDMQELAWV